MSGGTAYNIEYAAVEARIPASTGLARLRVAPLRNGMLRLDELELDFVTGGRIDGVWCKLQSLVADLNYLRRLRKREGNEV